MPLLINYRSYEGTFYFILHCKYAEQSLFYSNAEKCSEMMQVKDLNYFTLNPSQNLVHLT